MFVLLMVSLFYVTQVKSKAIMQEEAEKDVEDEV
jgi:hypothetical protein